ncbi:MAG: hypothetical protein ACRBB0_26615 [Pelagimonas sp.]|uniref:hypothetical protein n=1 Tax=Pelagimonas sp. TaxID=2073170 RepID=UPI003D6BC317
MDFDLALIERASRMTDVSLVVFEVQARTPAIMEKLPQVDLTSSSITSGAYTQKFTVGLRIAEQFNQIRQDSESLLLSVWDTMHLQRVRMRLVSNILFRTSFAEGYRKELLNPNLGLNPEYAERKVDCFLDVYSKDDPKFQGEGERDLAQKQRIASELAGWQDPDPRAFFTSEDLAPRRDMVRKMVQLSKDRGFAVAFVYLPSMHVPIDDAFLVENFQSEFEAELLFPDPALRDAMEAGGYKDASHLNKTGRALLVPWLGDHVKRLLELDAS